eukprot:5554821-Karenia_brevis.AAC.1
MENTRSQPILILLDTRGVSAEDNSSKFCPDERKQWTIHVRRQADARRKLMSGPRRANASHAICRSTDKAGSMPNGCRSSTAARTG